MNSEVKLCSKGIIVIPKVIRNEMGYPANKSMSVYMYKKGNTLLISREKLEESNLLLVRKCSVTRGRISVPKPYLNTYGYNKFRLSTDDGNLIITGYSETIDGDIEIDNDVKSLANNIFAITKSFSDNKLSFVKFISKLKDLLLYMNMTEDVIPIRNSMIAILIKIDSDSTITNNKIVIMIYEVLLHYLA